MNIKLKAAASLALALIAATATAETITIPVDGLTYTYISNPLNPNARNVSVKATNATTLEGDVTIPSTVTYNGTTYTVTILDQSAFNGAKGMTSISLPNTLTTVRTKAFSGCTSLKINSLPASVTSVATYVFEGCTSLDEFTFPSGIAKIPENFFEGSSISNVTIPSTVTTIGGYSFCNCKNLKSIEIPGSVETISTRAFNGAGLTSINVPESVKTIGNLAFDNCLSLTEVVLPSTLTSLGNSVLTNCPAMKVLDISALSSLPTTGSSICASWDYKTITLKVNNAIYQAVKDTAPWSNFTTVVNVDNSTTGVEAVGVDAVTGEDAIYTLTGIRLSEITAPGIYIVNGKKVMVK